MSSAKGSTATGRRPGSRSWLSVCGALTGMVEELHRNYHIPISNTAAATVLYENRPKAQRKAA